MKKRILSIVLCMALCVGMASTFAGCGGKADAFVIMTDLLDGLFNPFFYTSANDGTIVGMTQIGMLGSTLDANGEVTVAYGENEAVVTKDYDIVTNDDDTVTYTFVLKNGIKFADGHPLTMEDVLFNYYVYLDPVYTGSNTLYSTDILGLSEYRNQTVGAGSDSADEQINSLADTRAQARIDELVNLFINLRKASAFSTVTYDEMVAAINSQNVSSGYKSAISNDPNEVSSANLLADYELTIERFKEELYTDYAAAQESFHDAPYDAHEEFENEVFCFMFYEGYVQVEYAEGADGKIDRTQIKSLTPSYNTDVVKDMDSAVNYVYEDKISGELEIILYYWATGNELKTEYAAKAKEVILHEKVGTDGDLVVPNISGIVSLGHTDKAGSTITVNGNSYTVASGHNDDGTVTNPAEYDVLQITIDGVDPKAIWNFAISVAPQHYYGEGSSVEMNIAENKFGVEYASYDFMSKIIQSTRNVRLPMGAGAYKVTDSANSDNPSENEFYKDNVVYFKANTNFESVGEGINNANIEKIRYQVVSSNNAIGALESGAVHYISPALTTENYEKLEKMESKGYEMLSTDQLGYGYIGVNAAKINNLYLRRAIMCAMNTSLALDYYRANTAERIFWNMSTVSWAYPKTDSGELSTDNGHDYPQMNKTWNEESAKENILKNMQLAGYSGGESDLKVKFTIAGSTLQDHPTYKVFRDAAALLNSLGWEVTVVCDSQALTKISTGSLEVWAAAWSSALDPDMYQVYHKDSSATSTLAWGYNYLKNSGSAEELDILDELSELIDQARETDDQEVRTELYEEAMGYILDLAVELPVYQRDVLYAYNAKVIDSESLPKTINPYSSPLDRIWELKFAE
ncbi:MAG: hypothetical protein IIX23_01565 [Oscillospiraceae bacterium]|nr:hypothetical protein [Oscillospiraceae bacterium]